MLVLALLHPIANLSWWRWSVHPSTVIGIAALGGLYVWASAKIRQQPTTGQKIYFLSGLVVMFASLNGPIHDLSDDYLFSAHMVQHLLLTLAVPPLLLAGLLVAFVIMTLGFYMIAAAFSQSALGQMSWVQIFIANLLASSLMLWYLWRKHPKLDHQLKRALEGTDD